MERFWKFYAFAMDVKLNTAIYSIAILSFKCIYEFFLGNSSVQIIDILAIVLMGIILSFLQRGFFPKSKAFTKKELKSRTMLWILFSNISVIFLTVLFNLFSQAPSWAFAVLIIIFEFMLAAMWLGVHIALKYDTHCLNDALKEYQNNK